MWLFTKIIVVLKNRMISSIEQVHWIGSFWWTCAIELYELISDWEVLPLK